MMTRSPHWHRPQSPMLSSRPSTRSWTATGAPDARRSIWRCAGVGWDCGYCRRSPSSWRHGHRTYIDGLNGTRYVGTPSSAEAHAGINSWIALFASACSRSVEDAGNFEDRVRELQSGWRGRVVRIRRDSAVRLLIDALPAAPVLTTSTAAELVGRSFQATSLAKDRLVEAGVPVQVSIGRRNRALEAHDLVGAFTVFERRLTSHEGDTRTSTPARRVSGLPAGIRS